MKAGYRKIIVSSLLALLVAAPLASAQFDPLAGLAVPVINPGESLISLNKIAFYAFIEGFNSTYDATCGALDKAYKRLEGEARIAAIEKAVLCHEKSLDTLDSTFPSLPVGQTIVGTLTTEEYKAEKLKIANRIGTALVSIKLESFKEQFNFGFDKACVALSKFTSIQSNLSKATNALSLIGDNSALIVELKALDAEIQNQTLCRETFLKILDDTFPQPPSSKTFTVNNEQSQTYKTEKLRIATQIQSQIDTLKQIHVQLQEQIRIASRSWWKAVLVSAMLTVARESLSTIGTNLSNKFLNTDLGREINNAAAVVYDAKNILNSTSNKKDQIIIHSLLSNPISGRAAGNAGLDSTLPSTIAPIFVQMSNKCLQDNAANVSSTQSDYLQRLAAAGDCKSPGVLAMNYSQAAGQVRTQSLNTAQTQIGKSDYKSTYNCSGVRADGQKRIDAEHQALLAKYQDRFNLYYSMSPDDPKKEQAKQEMDAASKAIEDFDKKYTNVVEEVCTGLFSPATLIETALKDIIGNRIDDITSPNTDSLPFAQRTLSRLVANLTESLIFGKKINGGTLLNSLAGTGATLLGGALGNLGSGNSGLGASTNSNLYLSEKATGKPNEYIVSWDISSVKGATNAVLAATNLGTNNVASWSGGIKGSSTAVTITDTTRFELKVLDSNSNNLLEPSPFVTINPSSTGGPGNANRPSVDVGVPIPSNSSMPDQKNMILSSSYDALKGTVDYSLAWDVTNVPNGSRASMAVYNSASQSIFFKDNLSLKGSTVFGQNLSLGSYEIRFRIFRNQDDNSLIGWYVIPFTINSSPVVSLGSGGAVAGASTKTIHPRGVIKPRGE